LLNQWELLEGNATKKWASLGKVCAKNFYLI